MIGNTTNVNKKYTNVKFVSTVWPTDEKPYFSVLWDDYKETGKANSVSGKLSFIKPTFTPKKGKMWDIYWFKAFLEDGDEVVVIESTITNASKDFLNILLSCKNKNVRIDVKLNKNWYPTWYVTDLDSSEWIKEWRFSLSDRPDQKTLHSEIEKIFTPKQETVNELTEQDLNDIF